MSWKKLGRIYKPDGSRPWGQTFAANPVAEPIGGDLYRIYFSARDDENRSSIGWVEINLNNPTKILAESTSAVLQPGKDGYFDDSGCSMGCVVPVGEKRYLYYMGWHLTQRVPWQNQLGLAVSEGPGEPFKRASLFPVLPLSEVDPYTISYPWVLRENGRFQMWYGSNIAWGRAKEDMRHLIKYAESEDGFHWERKDVVAIDFASPDEYAICKPCVIKDGARYKMWFCSRGERYRIRLAESPDGVVWTRVGKQDAIDVSAEGWDADMIEYPCVFDHGGRRYLLYAGAGYGREGFGLAVWE
ncbi:MAG: hypothetical protein U1E81_13390 [Xanthobacteraceae bacterium]